MRCSAGNCVGPYPADVLQGLDRDNFTLEYQLIESAEMAERLGFRGSPTILIDGRDPFPTGAEPIGMSCPVFGTEDGAQGAPTEPQLRARRSRASVEVRRSVPTPFGAWRSGSVMHPLGAG
jgi:hypothetical protein